MKLADRLNCSGCAACAAACARKAIEMRSDEEGFLRPVVDASKCVECGLCAKACAPLAPAEPRNPLKVYAAKANDFDLRLRSSSGGLFSLLARDVFAQGGIVFGAAYDETGLRVCHVGVEDEAGLARLRGSKYLQSEIGGTLLEARAALKAGRKVLYTGTPCQIAGLRRFLGREYDNLLAVDVICHAVPTPLSWRLYVEARRAEVGGEGPLVRGEHRAKHPSWRLHSHILEFANGRTYVKEALADTHRVGFLRDLFCRPSCTVCACRGLRSGSDMTIADYWGVQSRCAELDDDCGVSVALLNTERGVAAWTRIEGLMTVKESDYEDVKRGNPPIVRSFPAHPNRARFFAEVGELGFDEAVTRFAEPLIAPQSELDYMDRFGWRDPNRVNPPRQNPVLSRPPRQALASGAVVTTPVAEAATVRLKG